MWEKIIIALVFKYLIKVAKRLALKTENDIDDEIIKDIEKLQGNITSAIINKL